MTAAAHPIVVPLDGSKLAELAVPAAFVLARAWDAPLLFVHVADREPAPTPAELDRAREIFNGYVAAIMRTEAAAAIPYGTRVVQGSAAVNILNLSLGAQFIVLASHGRSGIQATLIGSVADKVVRGATVPVLVMPMRGPATLSDGPIVVGVDGSALAEVGLEVARDLAKRRHSPLTIVRAYGPLVEGGVEFVSYPFDFMASVEDASKEYLRSIAAPGEETVCTMAPALDAITAAADRAGASLVVLTSHGKSFGGRIALGSTTDRFLHSSRRPLLIVPVGDVTPARPVGELITAGAHQ
ncbi:MAG: universal stress protein [Dehalococcoidia bacterium]